MPEPSRIAPPPRPELMQQLRGRLPELVHGWRLLAEDLLGDESRIEFVGTTPEGSAVIVLVGDEGQDLELIARGLSQRAWVEARLADWLQLGPDLPLRPEAGVRLLLLCEAFRGAARAAAAALGDGAPALAVYRCLRNGQATGLLLEPLEPVTWTFGAARGSDPGPEAPAGPLRFRTGLTESDIDLSLEERRALEDFSPRGESE